MGHSQNRGNTRGSTQSVTLFGLQSRKWAKTVKTGRKRGRNWTCKALKRSLFSRLFFEEIWRMICGNRRHTNDQFMAVKIRMKRVGAKNDPVFRIVVADGRSPRDGKFIEELGTYHPRRKGDNFTLDLDRAKYWLSKGAQPSETVASFIKKAGKAAAAAAPAPAPAAAAA